eukprot:m.237506 g.237506  ORF g.237506 m.237506 type:complete len:2160 (-) comp17419_c0_seq1:897-7376(-)
MARNGNRARSRSVLDAVVQAPVCVHGSLNDPGFHNHLTALNEAVLVGLQAESDPIADHVVAARDVLRQLEMESMLSQAELTTIYTDLNRFLPVTDLATNTRVGWRVYCSPSAIVGLVRAPAPTDLFSLPTSPSSYDYFKWDLAHPALSRLVEARNTLRKLPSYFPTALKQHLLAIAAAYDRFMKRAGRVKSQAELDALIARAREPHTLVGGLGVSLHTVKGTITIDSDNDDKNDTTNPSSVPRPFVITELPAEQRVPFSAIALWWLGKRLFDIPMHQLGFVVIADQKGTRHCATSMRTKPQISLQERLEDPSSLDPQRMSELAVLSLFALVSDPSGDCFALDDDNIVSINPSVELFVNPLARTDDGTTFKLLLPFLASTDVLRMPLHGSVRERLAKMAPASVILSWLADIGLLREQLERLEDEGLLPSGDYDSGYRQLRAGSLIRLHRLAVTLGELCRSTKALALGSIFAAALPVASEVAMKIRIESQNKFQTAWRRLQDPDLPTVEAMLGPLKQLDLLNNRDVHNAMLEQEIPYTCGATANTEYPDTITTTNAVEELLFALCLGGSSTPLANYSSAQKLELIEHVVDNFADISLSSLPSYWHDANLFHDVLRVASRGKAASPRIIWLFRDLINAWSYEGLTPLHQLLKTFNEDNREVVVQQINYLLDLGADIDGANLKKETPVDLAASIHPDLFVMLVAAGAQGGRRSIMLLRLYHRLRQAEDPTSVMMFQAMKVLTDRNRQLNWAVAIDRILPPLPNPSVVRMQGESLADRAIEEWAFQHLYMGGPGRSKKANEHGRRRVGAVAIAAEGNLSLSFKERPELPGLESAVGEFSRRLFGNWIAPFVELFKLGDSVPVLVVQKISGTNLHEVLSHDPQRLQLLEPRQLSMSLINAMLTCPEDGKPDNYIMEPVENGLYRLVCIDNERCMCPTSLPAATVKSFRRSSALACVRPKSVLLCMPDMLSPVHPEVRSTLLALDVNNFIQRWVAKANLINTQHRSVFASADVLQLAEHPTHPTVIGVPMNDEELPVKLYQKLRWLQSTLARGMAVTHLDVLGVLEPELATIYGPALVNNRRLGILDRFRLVDGPFLSETEGQPGFTTCVPLELFLGSLGVPDIQSLPSVVAGELACPEMANRTVTTLVAQTLSSSNLGQERCLLVDEWRRLSVLVADTEAELLLKEFDMSTTSTDNQVAMTRDLMNRSLRFATINFSSTLRDADLLKANFCRSINVLDLSGCSGMQLGTKLGLQLAMSCPLLRELVLDNVSSMPAFEARTQSTPSTMPFPRLQRLSMNGCERLLRVAFHAPVLTIIDVSNCPELCVMMLNAPALKQMDIEGSQINYCRTDLRDEGLQLCQLAQQEANDLGLKPDSFRSKLTARFKRGRRPQLPGSPRTDQDTQEPEQQETSSLRFWIRNVIEANVNTVMLSQQPLAMAKQMSKYSKGGLPKQLRGIIWIRLSGASQLLEDVPGLYDSALTHRFGQDVGMTAGSIRAPSFGLHHDLSRWTLSPDQHAAYNRILCCLAQVYPDRLYCPMLPILIAGALLCMQEKEAYAFGSVLLRDNPNLQMTRAESWLSVFAFDDLASRLCPEARQALMTDVAFTPESKHTEHPLRGVVFDWFANCLPQETVLTVLDAWLFKGRKIMYRYGLALLQRWLVSFKQQAERSSSETKRLARAPIRAHSTNSSVLFEGVPAIAVQASDALNLSSEAFAFSFSTRDIERSEGVAHEQAWNALSTAGRQFLGVDEAIPVSRHTSSLGSTSWQDDISSLTSEVLADTAPEFDWSAQQESKLTPSSRSKVLNRLREAVRHVALHAYSSFLQQHAMRDDAVVQFEIEQDRLVPAELLGEGSFGQVQKGVLLPLASHLRQTGDEPSNTIAGAAPSHTLGGLKDRQPVHRLLKRSLYVAVKSVKHHSTTEENALLVEAHMMMALQHPHLLQIIGTCAAERPYQLLVEYMPGGDLRNYLHKCSNPSSRPEEITKLSVVSIGRQIGSAMAFLEQRRIIHRDLACRNVLVSAAGVSLVKLADFGLAKTLTDDLQYNVDGEKIPFRWCAPEVLQTFQHSSASDVWSFAVLLWECGSLGTNPYDGQSLYEVQMSVIDGYRLPQPMLCADNVFDLMKACWSEDPAERPSFGIILQYLAQLNGPSPNYTGATQLSQAQRAGQQY